MHDPKTASPLLESLKRLEPGRLPVPAIQGPPDIGPRRPHPFEYLAGPALEDGVVKAVMIDPRRRTAAPAIVTLKQIDPLPAGLCQVAGHGAWCLHLLTLLADLAISPALRRAVIEGTSPEQAVLGLEEDWNRAGGEMKAALIVDRWARPTPGSARATAEVTIEVDVPRESGFDYDYRDEIALVLKLRSPPSRRVLKYHEVEQMRLPPDLRRILSLSEDPSGGRASSLLAYGPRAGLVLDILRAHPEWGVHGADFDDRPLFLQILRGELPSREVRRLTETWSFGARDPRTKVDVLEAHWQSRDGAIRFPVREALFFSGASPYVRRRDRGPFHPVDPMLSIPIAQRVSESPVIELPRGVDAAVQKKLGERLRGSGVGLPSRSSMGLPEAEVPSFAARIDGAPLDFTVLLEATYASGTAAISGDDEVWPSAVDDASRNPDLERAAADRITASGLVWDAEIRRFRAVDEDAAAAFWGTGIGKLRDEGSPSLDVFVSDRLAGVRVRGGLRSRVRASLVGNWLDTQVSFEADEVAAEMDALRDALARKRRWVLLRDGSLARIGAKTEEIAAAMEGVFGSDGAGRLSIAQIGLLEHVAEGAEHVEVDARVAQIRSRLRSLEVRPAEIPRGLQATLRNYQVQGLAWLQFLAELGTGGILADDMGLGKTLMALAFLLREREKGNTAPSLVVCPTSVAGNWVREANRFAPELSVLALTGPDRASRFDRIGRADLVVSTYSLLRLDVEALAEVNFRAVILDEAQYIKNASAATTQAARRLRAEQRLALTGTPVENRLGELWSIMEFCNPGMLGSERTFEARFERRVASQPGGAAAAELRARVRPFVLRRRKAQVLVDLPPKEEIDVPCLPGAAQRRAYDALAEVVRRDVHSSIEERGLSQSGLIVLTALLRLRQMCCDPRLVDPSRRAPESAKREVFLSLVRGLVDEGRRALVFSQFVELLRLWREDLDREGIEYVYLDGSTRHRDEVVARFQNGKAPLFLISLKAGGAGLNLTAADTVIHCDPWWNPAVEAQATDRTHRIGQTRPVTVYRLILRGSIEEKIAELKARKQAVADAVIREDQGALRGLAEEDVRLLLSGVDAGADFDESLDEAQEAAAPPPLKSAPRPEPEETGETVEGAALEQLRRDVREYVTRHALTQAIFSARAETSQGTISRLLAGKLRWLGASIAARIRRATED